MLVDGYGIIAWHFSCDNSSHACVTTCGFYWPVAYTANDMAAEGLAVMAGASTKPFHPSNVNDDYTGTSVTFLGQRSGIQYTGTAAGTGAGTVSGATPSINTSNKIGKVTANAGRKYRGVMMVPPFLLEESTEIDSGGNISSGRVTGINALFLSAFNLFTADTVYPYLLHGDATPPTILSSWTCRPQVGTIGRRIRT